VYTLLSLNSHWLSCFYILAVYIVPFISVLLEMLLCDDVMADA